MGPTASMNELSHEDIIYEKYNGKVISLSI